MKFPENVQKYLPSKKFAIVIGSCVGIMLIILITTSMFASRRNFFNGNKNNAPLEATGTVGELVSRDSNNNKIPDWEESLWGLDPKADGETNKKLITSKKLAAGVVVDGSTDQNLTPTDQFTRDFLATILALHQSGTLTQEAITNLAESIGQNIDTQYDKTTVYFAKDLKTSARAGIKTEYRGKIENLTNKYDELGTELEILGEIMDSDTESKRLGELTVAADQYEAFSADLISIETPKDIAPTSLALANASMQMSQALRKMQLLYTDAFGGMVGVDQYLEASTAFESASIKMGDYFAS